MKWITDPSLFAGGEFYCAFKKTGIILPIIGYADSHINGIHGDCFIVRNQSKQHVYKFTSEVHLFARRTEDMTEEERSKFRETIYDHNMWTEETLIFLRSIGVFPFEQSFSNGHNINRDGKTYYLVNG